MTDGFGHQVRLDQIWDGERLDIVANDDEREILRKRLGIEALDRLEAHVTLARTGEVVRAEGRILAAVSQSCVVTGEPVRQHVDEPFAIQFVPEPPGRAPDEEIELSPADCDTVFYDGAVIELGSAIADTLALSLDPYPRSAGADAALKEVGMLTEEQASPFALLARLKRSEAGGP